MTSDLESRCRYPYLTGVYLAANAITDAYLIVDGPNCVFFRTAQIQGNHDWWSDLVRGDGLHRVADTDCTTERAASGDSRLLLTRLQQVSANPAARVVLLTAMSMVALTGKQYERILWELKPRPRVPILFVPPGSLSGDWLAGYEAVCDVLARKLPLRSRRLDTDQVGIVGYGWDRNEGDHRGNLAEMSRLLSGLGLKLASCWLSGSGVSRLENIARAKTIIGFPYARTAARTIAQRLGARLIECELPIGIEATCDWLRRVGRATNRIERAESLIERELGQLVPRLEWLLPFAIQGKRALLLGDRHLVGALARALPELGVEPACQIHWNDPRPGERAQPGDLLVGPTHREVAERIGSWLTHGIDLAFSNSDGLLFLLRQPAPPATVEIGYPSYHTHALLDAPILGFRGVLGLVERMLNRLAFKALSENVHRPAAGREKRKKTPS